MADLSIKDFFSRDEVKKRFEEMLGKRAPQFITSVLQIASSNVLLRNADPISVYNAAAVAATLDLPLNNQLGFAYIVPYNIKQKDGTVKVVAQFQIGWKGYIQLGQRSGQFQTIAMSEIYEGQVIDENPLTGVRFDFTKRKSDVIIGYAGYFRLLNGFEKTLYMTREQVERHGRRYSKSYATDNSQWRENFDGMANKTVIRQLFSKFAPMSIEMQRAMVVDQSHILNPNTDEVEYIDNEAVEIDKESERIYLMIEDATTVADLKKIEKQLPNGIPEELKDTFQFKLDHLSEKPTDAK